ncbi:MAG: hypothetical protein A2487_02355 [Candidatus Raymondbacteria bacterium RifOxyC12_full_50_8]|uniref:Sulfatase-modifying factor enzyme-like domain-containing protein n=1 Tax=Candidatus Raymondbacteria bacterium RIFOXYD12_FULL_49_13 TaxID=1817890 RepID=A0A1F7FI11_UNCRA|nr:MAG: hypothetical protein A2248_20900 [Candidatus Raymondbacteria bacterium RIFOXYA2_FULL_49_16]OGJ99519.1 MAG: hypothetical protein A2350_05465 [Candidatus Raymondbacteria bacterium RifOxyB12_full_50_8]OGK06248.1 MAG: hypothetical protein A2519_08215 [Candidatus Raymondbacteria bacterium RIFOXYD12_FULL_49_13]OGK07705.1 MAG: hypothetical protein A2487_02355 [Candidatus Raymondbacteria bacterium RifOxyC12_full_50_8]OGP40580.1 MAG: hypothetical protein A2324_02970 [Candidatus Raymondbacteria b
MLRFPVLAVLSAIIIIPFQVNAELTYDTLDLGNGVSLELVLIPAGTFPMGASAEDCAAMDAWQRGFQCPQHQVTLTKPYWMGVYEVTQAQYAAMMPTSVPSYSEEIGPDYPAYQISPAQASGFCRKLSRQVGRAVRLPTDAEWEHACRAGTTTRHFWGDQSNQYCTYTWARACPRNGTFQKVGTKPANPWGLFDINGNVWEYSADNAYSYTADSQIDPYFYDGGITSIVRGGGIPDYETWQTSYSRITIQSVAGYDHGFRVVVNYDGTGIQDKKIGLHKDETNSISCFPNPFNPSTTIAISNQQPASPSASRGGAAVNPVVKIYNENGRLIETLNAMGSRNAVYTWNAADCPSGIYFAKTVVGGRMVSARLLLIK